MNELLNKQKNELVNFILTTYDNNSKIQTNIKALQIHTSTKLSEFNAVVYEPSLCIVFQGSKAVGFGDEMYSVDNSNYMLVSTHIPAKIKVEKASEKEPFVAIKITFTLEQIYNILKEITNKEILNKKEPEKGILCDNMSMQLFNPIYRLVKLLESSQQDMDFLVSLIEKEILFILLTSNSGDFLKQFVMEGSISNQIVKIVSEIKDNFSEAINMKELARKFDMSESSLYSYFKKVMMISPLQFQKKLRLEEAKQMLLTQDIGVNDVAIAVGYDSSSHFIREYSRMYGLSPKAHVKEIKYSNTKF